MAVDTRDKRASVIGHSGGYRQVFPNPSGGINTANKRRHVGMVYPSSLSGAAAFALVAVINRTLALQALADRTFQMTAPVDRELILHG